MSGITKAWPNNLEALLAAGGLDGETDDNISPTYWDRLISCLDYLGGTDGVSGWAGPKPNVAVNGMLRQWQRGTGPFTVTGAYTADRLVISLAGTDTLSVSKDTTNHEARVGQCAAVTFTLGSGAGASNLNQPVKLTADLLHHALGTSITLSWRVKTATASAVRIGVNGDGTGAATTYSSYHTGGSTWQRLTVTYVVPPDATFFNIAPYFAASATVYVGAFAWVVGAVAVDPIDAAQHEADDLARCLRYYEIHGAISNSMYAYGYSSAAGVSQLVISPRFATRKAVSPTVTKVGTWSLANLNSQPTVYGWGVDGYSLYAIAAAAGNMTWTAGVVGSITAEANP